MTCAKKMTTCATSFGCHFGTWHEWPFPLPTPQLAPSRIRRGTAPARRRPPRRSLASPGVDPPPPLSAPSPTPTGPAAARRAAPGTPGRGRTTNRSPSTGPIPAPGAAAWRRGVPPPRAPAADRCRPRPVGAAGPTARPQLPPQLSGRRLGGSGAARHSILFNVFSHLQRQTRKDKNHINKNYRCTCDADMLAVW